MFSNFQARDEYCESVSTGPSEALSMLQRDTLNYPFAQAYKDGKIKWQLNPRMMSGHFEGLKYCRGRENPAVSFSLSLKFVSAIFSYHHSKIEFA